MNDILPTRQDIEKLVAFLPMLYADGFKPVKKWDDFPVYDDLVTEFFDVLSRDVWTDSNYDIERSLQMVSSEEFIKTADIHQIKSMFTYCNRGERFSDGHWGEMIEKFYVRSLLQRLSELSA